MSLECDCGIDVGRNEERIIKTNEYSKKNEKKITKYEHQTQPIERDIGAKER